MKVLVFDTETTGLPAGRNLSVTNVDKWPLIIQLSYILYDTEINKTCSCVDDIIKLADDVHISSKSIEMHGITRSTSIRKGIQIADALSNFNNVLQQADWVIAHNISFDKQMIRNNYNMKNIKIVDEEPLKLLECSELAIVTSGTISLQASLMGTPCIVGYKLSFLSWIISQMLIKIKYISMTNIIANKIVIPEYIQYHMTYENITNEANKLLKDDTYYNSVVTELEKVKNIFLNKKNVMKNAANIIHDICNEKN